MKCYLVSYDLNKGSQTDYENLYAAIRSYSGGWAHINESLWAIITNDNDNATLIRDKLIRNLDLKDSIFVIKSGRESAWNNVLCKNEWLKNNL